jgi:hypothetical protein
MKTKGTDAGAPSQASGDDNGDENKNPHKLRL